MRRIVKRKPCLPWEKEKAMAGTPKSPSDVKNLGVNVTSIGQKDDKKEVYMRIQTFLLSYNSWLKL